MSDDAFLTIDGQMWQATCVECGHIFDRGQLHSGFKFGEPALICSGCRDELTQRFAATPTPSKED